MARTPRDLDDYRQGQREREIEIEAMRRDQRNRDLPRGQNITRTDPRDDSPGLRGTSRSDMTRFQQASRSSVDRLAEVVNDPAVVVDAKMMRTINDPNMVMLTSGEVARLEPRSRQFARENLVRSKPKRKKNPKLARAMKEANARGRKKNGGFKKGYDQARIARLAQKILKRMK